MRLADPKDLSRAEQARLRRMNQSSHRAESASKNIATQVGARRASRPVVDISGLFKSGFGLFKNKAADNNQAVERITNFYPNQGARPGSRPSIVIEKPERNIYTLIRQARFFLNKPGGLLHRRPARVMPVNMRSIPAAEQEAAVEKPRTNVFRPHHRPFVGQPGQAINTAAMNTPMAHPANRNLVVPRMVARAGASAIPLQDHTRGRVRKMVYYSLGSTGVEIKLPALPVFHPTWRLMSGAMVVFLAAAMALMIFAPQFKVSSVEVTGLQRLDPAGIPSILAMGNLPIIALNPAVIAQQVQNSFPELQSVQLYANLPSNVVINMIERQPVMVWEYSNVTLWIDAEGYLIPVRGESGQLLTVQANVPPDLANPEVKIIEKKSLGMGAQIEHPEAAKSAAAQADAAQPAKLEKIDAELLRAAFELNSLLPAGTTLVYDNRRGLGFIDPQGTNVFVGLKFVDMRIKLTEYQVIIKQLALQGIKPGMISVENLDVPFYRMEK
jgi:cell division protein FtsQ